MSIMKSKEKELLESTCKNNNLPLKLVVDLLKEAKNSSYENKTDAVRIKSYKGLIDFYSKTNKGE